MFRCCTVVFVWLVVGSSAAAIKAVKRSDIDLQTCIDNFDIHKDKIIRTQDSRNMGATYLNEIDLGSREECLRLCCETESCDVFVFEEKSPGSCYLFHCGPPEDFKCKFTQHANYSSAVLAVNRHLNELENQIKLTKHEQDLTRLRKPEEARPPESVPRADVVKAVSSTQAPTISTQVSKEVLPAVTKAPVVSERRCSRYQFECRSSGECIAIYNACDGIPQCSDGSDEAPELECPDIITTSVPTPPPPQIPVANSPFNPPSQRKQLRPQSLENPYQPPIQTNQRAPLPNIPRENTDFLRPMNDNRLVAGRQQAAYADASVIQAPQQPYDLSRVQGSRNWPQQPPNPIGLSQGAPIAQYADKNSHIFNHKENGIQVVDTADRYKYKGAMQTLHRAMNMGTLGQFVDTAGGGPAGVQYPDMNTRSDYPKMSNYYNDMYRQQYPIPDNWQPNRPVIHGDNPYIPNDNWQPAQINPQQNINDQSGQIYRPNVETKPNWKTDLLETQSKSYDHTIIREPKLQEELKQQKEIHRKMKLAEETALPEKKSDKINKNIHSHSKVISPEEFKQDIEDLYDGKADRPGGAILSLTLGVSLMCIMAILIGCKLRVVRRRMRRGGKSPYAHDADYLVNGMYL